METLTNERGKMSIRTIKKMKVGPIAYTVKHQVVELTPEQAEEGRIYIGKIFYDRAEIQVANHTPECVARQTTMHEAVHAMLNAAGCNDEFTEGQVDAFANVLIQFVQQNPQLIEAIQKCK